MVGTDYNCDYEYDNNYDCNRECDLDYDCNDDDSIGNAGWLPTKTNPSVHVPDPSTLSIDSPTVTNEQGSDNVLGSQIGITVCLYLALACVVFCAGFIWRFWNVQAAHKSSTVSGPNTVETKDSDTDNIETAGLSINASD
ncbi:hypothetical protein IWW56_002235 [Coemansia sp. RSA 2131]|nr:hypothetical protein IWW56_002235 [Coemansia sp. RSA 2131]